MRDSMAMEGAAVGNLAGVGSRFVALLIDGIIIGVIGGIIAAIFGETPGTGGVGSAANLVIGAIYQIALISQMGTTLGGRILGLRVVDSGGQPLSVGAAAIRWVVSLASGAVILIGYLWAFWDKNKQTWHDKAAGSFVVKA